MSKLLSMLLCLGLLATTTLAIGQQPAKPATPPPAKKPAPKVLTPEELAKKAAADKKRLEEDLVKVDAVLPAKSPTVPKKPRKLLIYTACKGYVHDSIPLAAETFVRMGKKTGAFEATVTADAEMFTSEKLADFDAVLMDNCTGDNLPKPAQKKALLEFVKGGKGIVGIHAATDAFNGWKEYGEMMGGYFSGHPFGQITVKVDDPASPINAVFAGKGFDIGDEIYTFRDPYSRQRLHILLSLDWEKSPKAQQAAKVFEEKHHWKPRADKDYALAWLNTCGQGRVFYSAFGHWHPVFWNPAILEHYLAGIQYALGDLAADASPSVK